MIKPGEKVKFHGESYKVKTIRDVMPIPVALIANGKYEWRVPVCQLN